MAIRIHCEDEDQANEQLALLRTGGYAAELTCERFAGEDDDTEMVHVVTTDAPVEVVGEAVEDTDAFVEVSDPMTGTKAGVAADELGE